MQDHLLFHAYGRDFDYDAERGVLRYRGRSTRGRRPDERLLPSFSRPLPTVQGCELVRAPLALVVPDMTPPSKQHNLTVRSAFLVDWDALRRAGF